MAKVNALKLIEKTRGNINSRYDATYRNFIDIKESSSGTFDLIHKSFIFGYAQGMKAAKAKNS